MLTKVKSYLLNDASFLFISTIIVNAGNYGINLVLGRILGPAEFAEASILATGVLILSFIAVGFQLTAAKYSATYQAENESIKLNSFISWIYKNAIRMGLSLTVVLLLLAPTLQRFLHFKSVTPLVLIIVCIPLYLHLSVSRGWLQGIERFKKLATTYIVEMGARLIITFALVLTVIKLQGAWSSQAVAFGFVVSFISTFFISREKRNVVNEKLPKNDLSLIYKFVLVIGIYEFSQILINNSDIILVKHYFDNEEAGLYAALALIGRVVFFATWTIVTLLFPKVIQKEKNGEKHTHLFWGALAIVASIGVIIILACYYLDELIINILFGEDYLSVADLLWKYAVATTLFACANVFAYYFMSLNKYFPVALSVIAGVAQIGLIVFFHESMVQVIYVQIFLMGALFCTMIVYFLYVKFITDSKNKNISEPLKDLALA